MKIGIIGYGFVGRAIGAWFSRQMSVEVYDKANDRPAALDRVAACEVIFVAVPTPMAKDGSCHTGIVEDALANLFQRMSDRRKSVVVIKSTVPPGFTDRMRERHLARIVMSPEFLTERYAEADFANRRTIIIGGFREDAEVLIRAYKLGSKANDPIREYRVASATEAELVKLFTNAFLMTKVMLGNEIYQICQKLGISYETVASFTALDERIGPSHFQVPGHDGHFGVGGHCLPKDIESLRHLATHLGTGEKLFSALIERNEELRANHDWLEMKGRAVL